MELDSGLEMCLNVLPVLLVISALKELTTLFNIHVLLVIIVQKDQFYLPPVLKAHIETKLEVFPLLHVCLVDLDTNVKKLLTI